jgi:hypothetical protein
MVTMTDVPEESGGPAEPAEPEREGTASITSTDLSRAYLEAGGFSKDWFKGLSDEIIKAAGITAPQTGVFNAPEHQSWLPGANLQLNEYEPIEFHPDPSPEITAETTRRMADLMHEQNNAVGELVRLTTSSLALSTKQREQNERSERFSRRMAWASVLLTAASLVAAIAAVIVSAAALNQYARHAAESRSRHVRKFFEPYTLVHRRWRTPPTRAKPRPSKR